MWISPWHDLRSPPDCNASGWPGCGCAISAQSRGGRFALDAGDIAFRLRIRYQAAYRRNRVAGRAKHATEISRTPGFGRRRRTGRERWRLGHGVYTAFVGSEAEMRETSRLNNPMRQTPPFSPSSSPPTKPGQPCYLRGMLCAFRHSSGPLDGLVPDPQSRCNLGCILIESRTLRLHLGYGSGTRSPTGPGEWRSARSMPRRYHGCPGLVGGDELGENGGV